MEEGGEGEGGGGGSFRRRQRQRREIQTMASVAEGAKAHSMTDQWWIRQRRGV